MKIKTTALVLLTMVNVQWSMVNVPANAQQLKQFTLEDLNFGGKNYKQMSPETKDYKWWGDELLRKEKDDYLLVNKKTGQEKPLTDKQKQQYEEWGKGPKPVAEVKNHNLFVGDRQLTTDGSREIVYGEAVHRNEFGIMEGLFWSPGHERLAFYRMDQSMVSDYPQVNIFERSAAYEPDKYPMAGETSHKVTVGIYDVKTEKTIYLKAGDPTDRYFTNIAWSPDAQTIYMFELNRDQNDCRLISYDAQPSLSVQ